MTDIQIPALQPTSTIPQPVELFCSDVHGEYEAFARVLRGGCGAVRSTIDSLFAQETDEAERAELDTLVCYPQQKLAQMEADGLATSAWLTRSAERLGRLANAYGCADAAGTDNPHTAVCKLAEQVQNAAVSHVHLLGDVYDRGPAPQLIMEELAARDDVDIVWGNHDVVWMGAAMGQEGCIAHVVRNCARYGNLDVLSDAYGIDLSGLLEFAASAYADDPCKGFALKGGREGNPQLSDGEYDLNVKVQKAMAILQFKVEAQLIDEHPDFGLDDRKLLGAIDFAAGTVELDGTVYPLTDTVFPTVDPSDPYTLIDAERTAMDSLVSAFTNCATLRRHMDYLLDVGSLYRVVDDMLLFHACVPLNDDGSLKEVTLFGQTLKGRALFDAADGWIRDAHRTDAGGEERKRGRDLLWYLWLGPGSPLFAKSKMATFEIYCIADKAARREVKNPFYTLLGDSDVLGGILTDFGLDPQNARIVCGHVPVKVCKGEDPVKCGGKAMVIDGGFSRAYHKTTGIAGFALVRDARGLTLNSLEPYPPVEKAIAGNIDITRHERAV